MTKLQELKAVLTISGIISFVFYGLFYLFFDKIHNFYPPIDKNTVLWWQQVHIVRDGIELPLMLFSTSLIVLSTIIFGYRLSRLKIFNNRSVQVITLIFLVFLTFHTRSPIFRVSLNPLVLFAALSISISLTFLFYKLCQSKNEAIFKAKIIFWILGGSFVILLILSSNFPSLFDYGFFLAPVLKLSQGEKLGSFYLQYGLVGVLVFKAFVMLNLKAHQMEIGLGVILASFFLLYFLLARKLIQDKFLTCLFMLSIVLVRFLGLNHDLTQLPQVLPFRLDLWVILLLVVIRFGFLSIVTSSAFSLIYILDNSFGLFYLFSFGLFLLWSIYEKYRGNLASAINLKTAIMFVPILISLIFQLYFFHSLTSPAGAYYQKIQLGFLPIDNHSPYWLFFFLLPVASFLFSQEKDKNLRRTYFFTLTIALFELVYFYGRSHDHNLLNISVILILILFLSLRQLQEYYKLKKAAVFVSVLFILSVSVLFSGHALAKIQYIQKNLEAKSIARYAEIDQFIDTNSDLFNGFDKNKLYVISISDNYLNYRYGIKQIGFFSPFLIHVFVNELTTFLAETIQKGIRVVIVDNVLAKTIDQLNSSSEALKKGIHFGVINQPKLQEVVLDKQASPSSDISQTKLFSNQGLSFRYPEALELELKSSKVILDGLAKTLHIEVNLPVIKPKKKSAEEYVSEQVSLGTLMNQGLANIPNFDVAYIKIWNKNSEQSMQFFLFKQDKVVEVLMSPSTDSTKGILDLILSTIKI